MYLRRGAVYFLRPEAVRWLPKLRRPTTEPHPVVVYSCSHVTEHADWQYVWVIPISTSPRLATDFCVPVAAGSSGGALSKDSWIRTSLLQPVAKDRLTPDQHKGFLPPAILREVDEAVATFAGMDES